MKPSRILLLPLLVATAAGCPKPYSGQAAVATRDVSGDVGGYVELAATLEPGTAMHTGAPRVVALREARCLDESICETALRDGKAIVGGKAEGSSPVQLTFVQPNGGETTVETVSVRFRPRTSAGFAIGPQPPVTGATRVLDLGADHSPSRYLCSAQKLSFLAPDHDAHTYACTPGVELAQGRWYLPSRDRSVGATSATVFVCQGQGSNPGERTSLAVYRKEGAAQPQRLSYEGEPSAGCEVGR